MLDEEIEIKGIFKLLTTWVVEIRFNNGVYWYDANKISESLALKLLNLIYKLELRDLNDEKANFPGLDLGDSIGSKIAFQISSRTDANKVISTLRTVVERKYNEIFTGGIKFLILSDGIKIDFKKIKPQEILSSFNPEPDIIYIEDLGKEIKKIYENDEIRFLEIKALLQKQLPKEDTRPDPLTNDLLGLLAGFNTQLEELKKQNNFQAELQGNMEFIKDFHLPTISIISLREELVKDCIKKLGTSSVLWISGNVSTGKTQLAFLIGKKFEDNAYWVDLRDWSPDNFLQKLVFHFTEFLNISKAKTLFDSSQAILNYIGKDSILVLNDLPDLTGKEQGKANFVRFLEQAISHNVKIVITSNSRSFNLVKEILNEKVVDLSIPAFTKEEVFEVLKYYGAGEEFEDKTELLRTLTEGHPLIINSACKYLQEHNWEFNNEALLAIFKNEYGQKYASEVYSRIIDSTEDQETKSLLYRLQVIVGTFTDAEIKAVGNIAPQINFTQERAQKLKGVWLQEADSGKLQLSPLIKALSNNINNSIRLDINKALGNLILSKGIISQIEASRAINYYYLGKDFSKLSFVLTLVLQESLKNKELFFDWGFDLYWYYQVLPKEIPAFFKVYIRFLQINVSIQHNKETDFLIHDLEDIIQTEEVGVLGTGLAHLMLCFFYSKKQPILSLQHFIKARKDMNEVDKNVPQLAFNDIKLDNHVWISFLSLRSMQEYTDWFNNFKQISNDFTGNKIEEDEFYGIAGHAMVHLTAIGQGANADENISILNAIIENALKVNLPLIAIYAIKYQIKIQAVYLNNLGYGHKLISDHELLIMQNEIFQYLVYDEYGRQLFYVGKSQEAQEVLSKIADITLPEHYMEGIDSSIVYSQLIGKEDSKAALYFILKALQRIHTDNFYATIDKIKLYGEVGISFWLNDQNTEAIEHLASGYELLLSIFDGSPEHQAAIIRYGHVVNYIRGLVTDGKPPEKAADGESYAVPVRGLFYFSIENLLAGGFYFEERKFMVATIFEDSFEYLGNYENARKWALKSIEISLDLKSPKFIPVLYKSLYYLIIDRNYIKALNLFFYIEDFLKEIKSSKENVEPGSLKQVIEEYNISTTNEAFFYQHLLIPIVITVVEDIITNKISNEDYPLLIEDLFTILGQKIQDASTFKFTRSLFENILLHDMQPAAYSQFLAGYKGEYVSQVQTVGNLLFCIKTDAKESLRLLLALMPGIDQFYKQMFNAFYRFSIVPFFEQFWINKFELYQSQFSEKPFWHSKSYPRFEKATWDMKLQVLFQALVHHLNIPTANKIDDWLYQV